MVTQWNKRNCTLWVLKPRSDQSVSHSIIPAAALRTRPQTQVAPGCHGSFIFEKWKHNWGHWIWISSGASLRLYTQPVLRWDATDKVLPPHSVSSLLNAGPDRCRLSLLPAVGRPNLARRQDQIHPVMDRNSSRAPSPEDRNGKSRLWVGSSSNERPLSSRW